MTSSPTADQPLFLNRHDGVGFVTPAPATRDVRVLLSPLLQEGMGDFAVGMTQIPAGVVGTRHSHPETTEIWMILSGRGRARIGDEDRPVAPGDVVYTPPGVSHQFVNDGDEPVTVYFLYSPSGAEQRVLDGGFK